MAATFVRSDPSGLLTDSRSWTVEGVAGGRYSPLTPSRLLDTRSGNGAPAARLGAGGTLDLQVTGRGGVPATGVSAVVLNVTAIDANAPTFLTAWPAGQTRPVTSNLNVVAGQTTSNLVTIKVGTDGKVSLYNHNGSVDVGADLAGWYGEDTVTAGDRYVPLTPERILDTRTGNGAPAARITGGASIDLQVTGRAGVPVTGVSAVVLNVTALDATSASFVTAWPAGEARPLASNINLAAGQTVPNLVIVKVGAAGRVSLYNHGGSIHSAADVAGWFGADPSGTAVRLTATTPERILDTRFGNGAPPAKVGPAGVIELQVTGRGGVPASGVAGVVLNVTAVDATALSFGSVWPSGQARPLASNLNYVAGQTVPNLVMVKLGPDGKVNLYNHAGSADLAADVAGWFVP